MSWTMQALTNERWHRKQAQVSGTLVMAMRKSRHAVLHKQVYSYIDTYKMHLYVGNNAGTHKWATVSETGTSEWHPTRWTSANECKWVSDEWKDIRQAQTCAGQQRQVQTSSNLNTPDTDKRRCARARENEWIAKKWMYITSQVMQACENERSAKK